MQKVTSAAPILDYTSPLTHGLMLEYINLFGNRYSDISVTYIGESILGKPIPMVTLGNANADRGVLYIGAHHGMEWLTAVVLLRFVNEFSENLLAKRRLCKINIDDLAKTSFIGVIPMLNPDGVELAVNGLSEECPLADRLRRMNGSDDFSNWQANARGVDLNHNYDAGFAEYKAIEAQCNILGGCASKYSGEYPESEPESGALANLLRFDTRIKGLITLHTQGEEIYLGCGDKNAVRIGQILARMSGYKLSSPTGTAAYGGLTDWYTRELGRPAFTFECGRGKNPLPIGEYFTIYTKLREILCSFPAMF